MGHVQSKRKTREKKYRPGGAKICSNLSDIVKSVTAGDNTNIHKVAGHRIYRDSVNLPMDQLSTSSGYFSSNEPSPNSSGGEADSWMASSGSGRVSSCARQQGKPGTSLRTYDLETEQENICTMTPWEELCTYKGIPLDEHPALTSLQNEQNSRLESMEQRMNKIRTNAQQAFDRKKFAHLFRAKDKQEHSETDRLLQEARDMLQNEGQVHGLSRTMEQKRASNKCAGEYSGEIIPVKIVSDSQDSEEEHYLPLATFGSLQFSEPVMILLLPFLLPLFIIVAFIRGMSETFGWKQSLGRLKGRRSS